MGYSVRLEFTLVSSINDSCLVRLIYMGSLFLFPGVCLHWSALPVFDIYIYIYIYILFQEKKTIFGHIRIMNLFPSY